LSAWKKVPGSDPWSLRVNPSSGNLHPTEAYLICGPIQGLSDGPAVFHYSPFHHALELLKTLTHEEWGNLLGNPSEPLALISLTSIYWRESWKYGERAFRYCNHDVGHAIAAVSFAAASAGWRARLLNSINVEDLSGLLGIQEKLGPGSEHPDCLLALYPDAGEGGRSSADSLELASPVLERLSTRELLGSPNELSSSYHQWPIIDVVTDACRSTPTISISDNSVYDEPNVEGDKNWSASKSGLTARQIFRRRRSAVAMDGITPISKQNFFGIAQRCCDPAGVPTGVLPWRPFVSLAIFVHRVTGLQQGLYLLARDESHESQLRRRLKPTFRWERPDGCPDGLSLYLLEQGDYEDIARNVSCYQDIASGGAFSLGMLARFETPIRTSGPGIYPRLFWETGLIGQILYLEAEARGVRATGIGCFHDNMVHKILGIEDRSWQSLYHFTVGGALEDPRLQTIPAYAHLE
jgi:SagB-type dehydrogenase family enzyme